MDLELNIDTNRTALRVDDLVYLGQEFLKGDENAGSKEALLKFFEYVSQKIDSAESRVKLKEELVLPADLTEEDLVVGSWVGDAKPSYLNFFDIDEYHDVYYHGSVPYCKYCHARLMKHKHHMSLVLASALHKITDLVGWTTNVEHVQTIHKALGYSEDRNFQKLRYFKLLQHGEEKGTWGPTTKGLKFLKGQATVPKYVQTFRNFVTNLSDELISKGDIDVVVETYDDFVDNMAPVTSDDLSQINRHKSDENPQPTP